ncbi:hypothetical protein D3C77_668380 [compost metagenome]
MRLTKKRDGKWSTPYLQGKYKHHIVKIDTQRNGKYYYLLEKGEYRYNSLWDAEEFASVEEAASVAKAHIDGI